MFDKNGIDNTAGLTPAQCELEQALRAVRPATPAIDRDRMMFSAGAASARRPTNFWRAAAAVLVVGNAITLTFALQPRESRVTLAAISPTQVEKPAETSSPRTAAQIDWNLARVSPNQPLLPSADAGYLPVRDAVLRWGVSALPSDSRRSTAGNLREVQQILDGPRQPTPAMPWSPLTAPLQRLFSGEQL